MAPFFYCADKGIYYFSNFQTLPPLFFNSGFIPTFALQLSQRMKKLKITELRRISPASFKQARKIPLIVVLDNVRSLHNVGSIFRTADAFRIQALYLCGITATPPHPEIHKTALGAENSVDWKYFDNTLDALRELSLQGYTLAAVEQAHDSRPPQLLPLDKAPYAILLGNEVRGVSQEAIDRCHLCIEIPQEGTKHSLNVSVAAGIVLWEIFNQFKGIYLE
jgi:tRNA G18 (ribose-2'-O)-methylase SpoU